MIISAPASSANLGPGFDALSLALDVNFSIALNEQPKGGSWEPANDSHPAIVSYKKAGGVTPLNRMWTQSHIPFARGMGFSGAARVAGAYAALIQNGETDPGARDHAFRIAGDLEGHDDNAAASTYGGFCVTTGGHVMRFDCEPKAQGLCLVMFTPETNTSTQEARSVLPQEYSAHDTIESVGRVAMLTALLASNTFNDDVLKLVTSDVLHQPVRLETNVASKAAYRKFIEAGAVATWLSGSGSSVAAFVAEETVADVTAAIQKLELDCTFSCTELEICQDGVRDTTKASQEG